MNVAWKHLIEKFSPETEKNLKEFKELTNFIFQSLI